MMFEIIPQEYWDSAIQKGRWTGGKVFQYGDLIWFGAAWLGRECSCWSCWVSDWRRISLYIQPSMDLAPVYTGCLSALMICWKPLLVTFHPTATSHDHFDRTHQSFCPGFVPQRCVMAIGIPTQLLSQQSEHIWAKSYTFWICFPLESCYLSL
jgi:hypothetical protein